MQLKEKLLSESPLKVMILPKFWLKEYINLALELGSISEQTRLRAYVAKEGKNRNLWIAEFSKSFLKDTRILSKKDKINYLRGYFDAEGGIAKSKNVRYYLYFCQKDKKDLEIVKEYLEELGISCGKLHNPSVRIDPNYWRFFIGVKSYEYFAKIIGSSHPDKKKYLRMKI